MAEQKKKTIVSADSDEKLKNAKTVKPAKPVGNASGLRVGAVILWVVAIAFEVLALLVLLGKINIHIGSSLVQLIIFLVLDLICVIIGAQLWKKANHIQPASEKNKFKFWLWNNMGVVVCAFAFIPFIILLLTNKNVDKKTKIVALIAALVALVIGGAASYDWNPISVEEQTAAEAVFGEEQVVWAPFGKVYHIVDYDAAGEPVYCSSLNQSDTLTIGTVDQAIAAGRTRLCSFCAKRHNIEGLKTEE